MMIDASEAVSDLGTGTIVPVNEAQVRPLTTLKPAARPAAWNKALEIADAEEKPVTAAHVRTAVDMFFDEGDRRERRTPEPVQEATSPDYAMASQCTPSFSMA